MKSIKSINGVCLFVLTLILIGIIGTTIFAEEPSILKKVVDKGIMTVGVPKYENFSWISPITGKWEGISIDIMDYLAEMMGVKIEYKEVGWPVFPIELENGSIDIFASTAHYTVPRAMKVAFPYPVLWQDTGILTLTENADKYKTLEDVNKKGVKIIVMIGSYEDSIVPKVFPNATILRIEAPSITDIIMGLKSGQADLVASSTLNTWEFSEKYDWLSLLPIGRLAPGMQSFPVKYGDWEWFHFLDSYFRDIVSSGFVDRIVQKWFPNMPKEIRDLRP